MKSNSQYTGRFALTGAAFAAMCLVASNAWALGLGRLNVQSALGENLRADIEVTSITAEEAAALNVRVAPPESYRAAGVDYNAVLPGTQVVLQRRADGRAYLSLTSDRAVQEPFVDVILEINWSTGRLVREYTLLLDPPNTRTAATPAPVPQTAPAITAAPRPAEPVAAAPAPVPRPRVAAPVAPPVVPPAEALAAEPRRPVARAAAPSAPTAPVPAGDGSEYSVKRGDTLSGIARSTQRQGVSLDQMLAALYQANQDAFVNNNINRLKSGVVLSVPTADAAKSISPTEARQLIQAQSVDFGAYRQRMAAAVPSARTDGSSRQATGTVQSSVEDRKTSAAPAPDKLTLSKGAGAGASAPEDRVSREREQREASARVAELAKNVDELKKLQSASASGRAGASSPAGVPSVAAPALTPPRPPVVASAPAPAPVAASTPAPVAAVPAPAPASVPQAATTASAPTAIASAAPAVTATAPPTPVTQPVPAPSAPATPSAVASPADASSASGSLFEDNPLLLAAGAALIALLAGFGIYRFTKRAKKDSGETSFLESRLQPDSFFGASGGQRIDTRDATGASSSMSYSLSQLDAIGDVDPVAEADVYLAYGRDLQAEEILKEAMRASPERLAIRTKLLEVYAKRRDTKGFELLATQLYGLTGGQGEDWAKAQEIGLQIDPENPLYHPGGAPASTEGDGGRPAAELLGASTMPQSVLPSPSEFGASQSSSTDFDTSTGSSGLDLDLDLGLPDGGSVTEPMPAERTQALSAVEDLPSLDAMDFELPPAPAPAPAPHAASSSGAMEFDLGSISLDLGEETDKPAPSTEPPPLSSDFGSVELDAASSDEGADPISRKLELAEEFRQIGDVEGARDLLQEVVAKSSGAVKSRAQAMLDDLA